MEKIKAQLEPIERKSLYIKISDSIYSYIRKNGLHAGDRLPSEREMASMLKTSRHSVREALRILEDRGLIHIKTGIGIFIKDQYGEENTISFRLTGCSIEDIQELQNTLDHQAVLNAMKHATSLEKKELISIATEMINLAKQNLYSHTLDHSFHSKLYQIGRNKAIQQLINQIRDNRFIQREFSNASNDSVWLATVNEHFDLAVAINEKNKELAFNSIDTINNHGFHLLK